MLILKWSVGTYLNAFKWSVGRCLNALKRGGMQLNERREVFECISMAFACYLHCIQMISTLHLNVIFSRTDLTFLISNLSKFYNTIMRVRKR